MEARAKAEAALTRATYAQKEIEVRVKQAQVQAQLKVEETRLEATLNALQESEAEAAAAEASVFEAAAETGDGRGLLSSHESLQRTEKYVEDQHKYKEGDLPMLVESTKHKPLAPYSVNLLQPQAIKQHSPFKDLPVRSTTTQILTNAATPLSSHTIHTQAESIKQAGGNISQFNSALPDALPPKQNITFTSHSSSHRNERHAARSDVFELEVPGPS